MALRQADYSITRLTSFRIFQSTAPGGVILAGQSAVAAGPMVTSSEPAGLRRRDLLRAADGEWRFRAITPDGPFEEQDVEFSTPESLIASGDVEVVRDSGALMGGRVERRRLEIRRTQRRFGQRPG